MRNKLLVFLISSQLLALNFSQLCAQQLKVMSYNIHHGADASEHLTLEQIGEFIRESGADLVGLQEVDSLCRRSGSQDQMKILAEITGMHYSFYRHFAYDGGAYGLGVLSRFPIESQQNYRITSLKNGKTESLAFLGVKVKIRDRELLFSTVHLALDQPTRMKQAQEVIDYLKGEERVILTGDMNALPQSEEMRLLSKEYPYQDQTGGFTFPDSDPQKKIDYIFSSASIHRSLLKATVRYGVRFSDHLPLVAEFEF